VIIPEPTIDGILPPFTGGDPGGGPALMSPYEVGPVEVVQRFGTTDHRRGMLKGWLDHRGALRGLGVERGFQWLDGSFVEEKDPHDLDLVIFVHRPTSVHGAREWGLFLRANQGLFDRRGVKQAYSLDTFFLDMNGNPETLVSIARYLLQLFSHQRETYLWKGILQVRLEDTGEDGQAMALLTALANLAPTGGQP
jgi:hypothetical protein